MFSLTRRFPLFRKVVIAFFAVPLMFAGGSLFGDLAQSQSVGEVGSLDIPRSEFVGRYQSALEEYRRRTGNEEVPAAIAERISLQVRNDLLSYYLMKVAITGKGIYAPDSAVVAEIRETPDFHDEDGRFSPQIFNQFVSDRRHYQQRVREDIGREPIFRAMMPLPQAHIRQQLAAFQRQQRVVDEAVLPLDAFATATVDISADDINLYYQQNSDDYRLREQAAFEYFIFSLDDFAAAATVSADDIRAAYEDFAAEQSLLARRRTSHIYIEDKALASEVFAQAQAAPEQFAALAAEYSEDAFSAESGGSLGIVADGDLPPALNEVLFAMQVGQVHEPVETEQGGFSILKLDAIISEEVAPLEEIQAEMKQRAQRLVAQGDFEAQVEQLREQAPLEIGSLAVMAAAASAPINQRATVYRSAAENTSPFDEEAVVLDAFDPQVVVNGENSAPIPLNDDSYLFVRAARYQPAGLQPLAEVEQRITKILRAGYWATRLQRQQVPSLGSAAEGSGSDAIEVSDLLKNVNWEKTHTLAIAADEADEAALNAFDGDIAEVGGLAGGEVDALVIDRIFSADLSYGLPAYVFIPRENEIRMFRIRDINNREPRPEDYAVVDRLLQDMTGQLSGVGYLDQLNRQYEYEFYDLPEAASP